MDETAFQEIAELALQGSGQSIPPEKSYLVEARLSPILRREGFAEVEELLACIKARPNSKLSGEAVAALTSKQTHFFSGRPALEQIVRHILPKMAQASKDGVLRVWCAGGSSGQEAYSLAMMLEESDDEALNGAKVEILSTDICDKITAKARAGRFGHFDVQKGLSIQRLLSHFSRLDTGDWQISKTLAARVGFRVHNLMEEASGLGLFDVILCRNVLSGMARPKRSQALLNLARQLTDNGLLILGSDETANGLITGLAPSKDVRGAYSRKVAADALQTAA